MNSPKRYLVTTLGRVAAHHFKIAGWAATLFLLLAPTLHAHDWEEAEGIFLNASHRTLWCFWDEPGRTCFARLPHLSRCYADAVSITPEWFPLEAQRIFKIPNRSFYACAPPARGDGASGDLRCLPGNAYSAARFQIASVKNGAEKYGRMTLERFFRLMGEQPLTPCALRLAPARARR